MRLSSLRALAGAAFVSFHLSLGSFAIATPSAVVPPRAINVPDSALHPKDADISVDLEITITETGEVRDVHVVAPGRPEYDNAATSAITQSTFAPATKDGVPVAVRIRYSFVFRAEAAPVPMTAPDTDADTTPPSTPSTSSPEPSTPPSVSEEDQASFGARAVVDAPPRETTTRTLDASELKSLGTRGDPIRAVELLPGFARTTLGQTQPIVRGSAGHESEVFLDGMPVPLLYHFGGLTSFIPARFLDRVDYYPGNFSARYGRVMGGVIDVRFRDPRTDQLHGHAEVSLVDASASLEGPIAGRDPAPGEKAGTRLSAAVGFRRSYVDLYFKSIAPSDAIGVDTAPVYYDYQGILRASFGDKHRARVFVVGSDDRLALVQRRPSDSDPFVRGKLDAQFVFHRLQADLKSTWSDAFTQEVSASFGFEKYRFGGGAIVDQNVAALTARGRAEWIYKPVSAVRFTFGLDHVSQYWNGTFEGARPRLEPDRAIPGSLTPRTGLLRVGDWFHAPAAYAEGAILLGDRVVLIPSVRADYFGMTNALTVDPRFAVRARVTDTTTLKAGVGKFTQHPQVWQALPDVGNTNLKPGFAIHTSAGVEQRLTDSVRVSAEGFFKTLHDVPTDTPNFSAPYFDNIGRGRIYGLEFEGRVLPKNQVYGLVAYTLSRSERAREGEPLAVSDFDQTHIGSAAVVVRLGRGWEAGATFRATSSYPRTPIVGAVYDARTDSYSARYGARNSDRSPLYHRLDLRLEKTWTFTTWKFAAFAEVQNAYNAKNAETLNYNYDYTKSNGVPSYPPFFPNIGIRGEL